MDDDQINRVYQGEIFTQEAQRRSRDRIHWLVENARGSTVLDVGCSQGITSILLGRKGFNCLGVDIATPQIEYAIEELSKEDPATRSRVRFEVKDARAVRKAPFDTIILGQVLEHDPDPAGLLDTLLALLDPEGRLLISVPYGYQPSADHQRSFYIDTFLELLSPRAQVREIRVLNRFLVAIAGHGSGEQDLRLDQRALPAIEELLDEVMHEVYSLKEKLRAKADEAHLTRERLKAKADENQTLKRKRRDEVAALKEKLGARAEEAQRLREKLRERGKDVQRLTEKIRAMKTPPSKPAAYNASGVLRRLSSKLKQDKNQPG